MLEYETVIEQRINKSKLSQCKEKSFVELKINRSNLFDLYIEYQRHIWRFS
jgi:hypothetical protein